MAAQYLRLGYTAMSLELGYSLRSFDSDTTGWIDGGGDTFDSWGGFTLTIDGQSARLVSGTEMNDASGNITSRMISIAGKPVAVSSMWYLRDYFCIQCRYEGKGVLWFGGGVGSDSSGVTSKSGLIGSSGGTTDPRIWWQIIPLLANEVVDQTITGIDPINITTTPISEGFALLFGWAPVTHDTVLSQLAYAATLSDNKEMFWLSGDNPVFDTMVVRGHSITAVPANQEPREQYLPNVAWSGSPPMWQGPVPTLALTCTPANTEPREVFQPQDVAWRGTPPMWQGPVPDLPTQEGTVLCKGRDYHWWRDNAFNVGAGPQSILQGFIEGVVTINGVGVARRKVMCLDEGFGPVDEVWTDDEGRYRFDLLWLGKPYVVMAMDSNNDKYAPAAADRRLPEAYQ